MSCRTQRGNFRVGVAEVSYMLRSVFKARVLALHHE
uniref:Uncharacterized protein n=1 Tax=Anguilla anguilla TaxID=7936 RepID=A0A0E9TAN9_ANGAN